MPRRPPSIGGTALARPGSLLLAGCATSRPVGRAGRSDRGRRERRHLGQHPGPARRLAGAGTFDHRQPGHRSARLRAHAGRCAADRRRGRVRLQRRRLRQLGRPGSPGRSGTGAPADRRRPADRHSDGRQSASLVRPGRRHRRCRRDHRGPPARRSGRRRVLRPPACQLGRRRYGRLPAADHRHPNAAMPAPRSAPARACSSRLPRPSG